VRAIGRVSVLNSWLGEKAEKGGEGQCTFTWGERGSPWRKKEPIEEGKVTWETCFLFAQCKQDSSGKGNPQV